MKILFLTDNFPPERNASASRVYERAAYWTAWGHEVTVVTSAPNFPEGKVYAGYKNRWHYVEYMDGIRVVRVKTFIAPNEGTFVRTADFVSYMLSSPIAGLFEQRPDVVVATSPQFFAAMAGWVLAALRRLPFVFELSDLWPASISAVGASLPGAILGSLEALELFLYRRSAAVVALTPAFKEDLVERGIAPAKVHVVINGVDLRRFQPRGRDEALAEQLGLTGRFVVGYIGTHGMAHGLENVCHAAQHLRSLRDVRFMFVGAGAAREHLVALAKRLELDNILFVPAQGKEEIQRFWSLCDVALIHLRDDPVFSSVIPSKTFEAMAMGLPVLYCGPAGEISRIIDQEAAGVCVPAAAPAELAAGVTRLYDDPALRRALAAASLRAAPKYSRERQARDMLTVLEQAAGVSQAPAERPDSSA